MEFNLRPLKSTDLFAMVRILNGIGFDKLKECINVSKINEARKKLSAEENKDDVIAEIGIEVVTSIAGVLLENIPTIETDLYNFMGSIANMKTKDVANLGINDFMDLLFAIAEKEEFKDFFKRASKLIR